MRREDNGKQLPRVDVVVDHEHPDSAQGSGMAEDVAGGGEGRLGEARGDSSGTLAQLRRWECYASLTPGPHVRGRHKGEIDMAVKITARPNGPYLVEGEVELYDPAGNKVDTTARGARMALCRCGGSVTKPFCDGTHSKIGFQAAEAAVAQEQK